MVFKSLNNKNYANVMIYNVRVTDEQSIRINLHYLYFSTIYMCIYLICDPREDPG
jgi:hypothetical protein